MNPPFPNIAEALRRIAADPALSDSHRRKWRIALAALAKLQGRPPETIQLDPRESIALMERSSPAALRLTEGSMANYRSGLRAALRHLGLLSSPPKSLPPQDPVWIALLEQLPQLHDFGRLRAFVHWLSSQGVAPDAVEQSHLAAYLQQREASRGGSKQVSHARRIVSLWRRAAQDIQDWPQAGLANPKPRQLSLPFEAYPAPLAQQAETYLTEIASSPDIFGDELAGQRPAVSARTVDTRRHGVRMLLWGAHEAGIPMQRLNSLHSLLEQDILKASFKWHMGRKGLLADKKIDAHLTTCVATVFSVANYLHIDGDERTKLKGFLDKLERKPPPQGLIDRHERILEALDDPRTRAMFLHLPTHIMKQARRLRDGWTHKGTAHAPRLEEAAWLAGIATAIEIELHAPLRVTDLVHLRLGEEIRLSNPGKGRALGTLHLERSSKTGQGLQVPLQPETLALLREYLQEFRPLLRYAPGVWLFPGDVSVDKPRAVSGFGTAITENITEYLGLRINTHAFRAIAGALILEADPHAIDDVRAMLGHATFSTALRYYRRFSTRAAATRLGQTVAGLRRSSRHFLSPRPLPHAQGKPRKPKRQGGGAP